MQPRVFSMNKRGKITERALNCPVSPADRLAVVLRHSKAVTLNALAQVLKLNRAENLYQIKKGNNNISVPLAKRIAEIYPQFNIGWLTTGVGEPFHDPEPPRTVAPPTKKLPFFPVLDYRPDGTLREADSVLPFPPDLCPSAELVTVCRDDALAPCATSGDYLFLIPSKVETVIFGRLYLIVTASARLCRIIRRDETESRLRLVPLNPERYDEIALHKEHIRALYRICGIFRNWDG